MGWILSKAIMRSLRPCDSNSRLIISCVYSLFNCLARLQTIYEFLMFTPFIWWFSVFLHGAQRGLEDWLQKQKINSAGNLMFRNHNIRVSETQKLHVHFSSSYLNPRSIRTDWELPFIMSIWNTIISTCSSTSRSRVRDAETVSLPEEWLSYFFHFNLNALKHHLLGLLYGIFNKLL